MLGSNDVEDIEDIQAEVTSRVGHSKVLPHRRNKRTNEEEVCAQSVIPGN